jgi:TonB dependent receptor
MRLCTRFLSALTCAALAMGSSAGAQSATPASGRLVEATRGTPLAAGSLRGRYVDARATAPRLRVSARDVLLWDAAASWRRGRATLTASVENLFGCAWNESQLLTTVRLRGLPPAPVTELRFAPGAPRHLRLGVDYRF